jgi:hypothetical protein
VADNFDYVYVKAIGDFQQPIDRQTAQVCCEIRTGL